MLRLRVDPESLPAPLNSHRCTLGQTKSGAVPRNLADIAEKDLLPSSLALASSPSLVLFLRTEYTVLSCNQASVPETATRLGEPPAGASQEQPRWRSMSARLAECLNSNNNKNKKIFVILVINKTSNNSNHTDNNRTTS